MHSTTERPPNLTRAADAPASGEADLHGMQASLLSLLVDELAHGIIVVNAACWILHANVSAQRELYARTVLTNQFGRLAASLAENQTALEASVQAATRGRRDLIDFKIGSGSTRYSVAVVPLNRLGGDSCGGVALFLPRSEVQECGVFSAFARSQNLTRTEQTVLLHLRRCQSTPEIAIELGVAVSTVRSHVRNLCAKTGSSGVRELVNRVTVLAPIAAPYSHEPGVRWPATAQALQVQ